MSSTGHANHRAHDTYRFIQYIMNAELDGDSIQQELSATSDPMPRFIGQYFYKTHDPHNSPATYHSQPAPASPMPQSTPKTANISTILTADELKSLVIKTNVFHNTNWQCIDKTGGSTDETKMAQIDVEIYEIEFVKSCDDSLKNDSLPFIPVVVNTKNSENTDCRIEYVKIIKISGFHTGIGIKYHNITKKLLHGFCARFINNELVVSDIITSIMRFCVICEVSTIHLDLDFIIHQHQVLPEQKQIVNFKDANKFRPFITNLIIEQELNQGGLQFE